MADVAIGLNIALGDTDAQRTGDATYGLRHEQWPCGTPGGRTNLGELCEFWLMSGRRPSQVT